jgi:hypothetical protein
MEFQILRKLRTYFHLGLFGVSALLSITACEKEIEINLPPSKEEIVVEASINQLVSTLNYVIISKTVDYFKPDLSLNSVSGAKVYITEGKITGTDTSFNIADRQAFIDLFDTLAPGVYINPFFQGKIEKPYLLEIELEDGRKISGKTIIPKPLKLDSTSFWFEQNGKDTNAYIYLDWFDGPEQNNYRFALLNNYDSIFTGWGIADRFYTFDDERINNQKRPFVLLNPYKYGDTVHYYMAEIGRKEFLFWDSFRNAANNGGPFSTPIAIKSNVSGAIGSFTGYGITYKKFILR